MKLKVKQVGNPDYPRYSIACENSQWFDGTHWTPFKKKAALYASLPVVRKEWKRLSQEMESGLIELVGTLVVRLHGVKDLTAKQIDELAVYLSAASSFILDYKRPRPAWLENASAVVSCQIHWNLKPRN
ncbi:MAG: hypothetical protein HYX68_14050 [Planctomycetes bacterium]|nr:hypothetical protein [Planctomycetota bacterium]